MTTLADEIDRDPAMVESGVPWIGSTPSHWRILRLKTAVRRIIGGSTPASGEDSYWDGDVTWVTPSDISKVDRLKTSERKITRDGVAACATELVPPGSLVITTRAPIGNVALAEVELCTNQGCKSLVHSGVLDPRFALWMFQILKSELQSLGTGTTFDELSTDALGGLRVPVPPRPEQDAIVQFLDHADRRIRRAIGAKQKLIALLEEQKQAVIDRAVTRGLDPSGRFRPSGVDWLGDVPAHWDVRRSKQLFRPRTELARKDDVQLSATQAFGVIPQADYEQLVGRKVTRVTLHLEKRRHVEIGDFVISMRSFQGGLERAHATGCVRSSYVVLRPGDEVDADFFSYVFKSRGYIRALQATANFIRDGQDMTLSNFAAVPLAVPPLAEQAQIARELRSTIDSLRQATDRANAEVTLLREYRLCLIADVVTGRLDVRALAAQLPDEVDEPEPFDDELDLETVDAEPEPVEA